MTLAGKHADHMLVLMDEASGVPDPVFLPIEGGMTGPCNLAILIGNPTQNHGYFYDSFTKHRQDWIVLYWNAEESELVSLDHIARMARKYGTDSNAYRIRVQGLPPNATPDTLIPYEWVKSAMDLEISVSEDDPVVLGIDVGRQLGGDPSIILRMKGLVVQEIQVFNGVDTTRLAEWVLQEIADSQACAVAIDVIGWGAGTYDTVSDLAPCMVLPVNVAESASNAEMFTRLRDEIWWKLREDFQAGIIGFKPGLAHVDDLVGELGSIHYNHQRTAKEKIKIESKQEMRDRGVESPNLADALCLARYASRFVGRAVSSRHRRRDRPASAWVG